MPGLKGLTIAIRRDAAAPTMPMDIDPTALSMTEIIRLQNLLSQELTRRFEISAALAFTDISGSTSYFARFGDESGRKMQQLHLDLLEQTLALHGGRLVDTAGDGAFTVFSSASAAAEAMMALLHRISEANEHRTRDHQLTVHIGIHWGRVLSDGSNVTGDAVNLCARIASSAEAGQIRLTRDMFKELDMAHRLLCRPIGVVELKGIGRGVELMGLEWRDAQRFPVAVRVRETGQLIPLPAQDIISFGRLEMIEGMSANDIVLALPDPEATRQISRWHFELRRRPEGYTLRALSTQETRVDRSSLPMGDGLPIGPGTIVELAGVMTLEFISGAALDPSSADQTLFAPRRLD